MVLHQIGFFLAQRDDIGRFPLLWGDFLLSFAIKPLLLTLVSLIELLIHQKGPINEPDLEAISTRSSSHT